MYNKWELFINKYNKSKKITLKKNKLQLYAQMGIPKNFRGEAWYLISKAYILRKKTKPDFFSQLDSLTIDADVESSINRDLHRQMTNHSLFHSQVDPKTRKHRLSENHSNLYKVLKGVALFDLKTGYCQVISNLLNCFCLSIYNFLYFKLFYIYICVVWISIGIFVFFS